MRIKRERNYVSLFDEKTGRYFRSGIIADGKDTGKDPFMASFPELLDVGIMGHCIHGHSGLCVKAGVECYQDGLHANAPDMLLDDFRNLARQCRGRTFQFALGGCGDPDQHPYFEEILKICCENSIVPNFTTSGFGMTERIARLCRQYCGAVAVSWYRSTYTLRAIRMLLATGVKTNIHYVLTKDSVKDALCLLKQESFPEGINAIIFLLHKPVGLGTKEKMITQENQSFKELIEYIGTGSPVYKIGFDSCSVPAIINLPGNINPDSLDTCEGARWSAYITADMKMLPCSFDNQEQQWAVDLRQYSVREAWESRQFNDFRNHFLHACPNCAKRDLCMGGCPIRQEVVLCNSQYRSVG